MEIMEKYLCELLSFHSVSSDQNAVLMLLKYIKEKLQSHSIQSEILTYNGIHSLYASTNNTKHTSVLLQAHVDIVPSDGQNFRTKDGKAYGRGSYDMLYAVACYLQLLDDAGSQLTDLDIGFMFSGDEELGGMNGVNKFLEDGYTTEICILPDAGEGFGSLNIAAKGVYNCTIDVAGISHHGSRPWEGDGAAIKLIRLIAEIDTIFDRSSKDNSTCTVTTLKSGHATNQGPSSAQATLDIRYSDKNDLRRIKTLLSAALLKYDAKIIKLVEGDNYQLDMKNQHVQNFISLYEQHNGKEIRMTSAHGSSDARFFYSKKIPVIMLRPKGGGAHGDNEWISWLEINKFYELLKDYVTNNTRAKEAL